MKIRSFIDGSRELVLTDNISVYFNRFIVALDGNETHLFINEHHEPIMLLTGDTSQEFIKAEVEFV